MKNVSKIGIVVDSTTTLSDEIKKEYGIKTVSLNVETASFSKKEEDIKDEEIIEVLDDVQNLKTSSPSPNEFVEAYQQLFDEGYEYILVFPLSKGLSSTYQSAFIAKSYFDNEDNICVFDTGTANYGVANIIETLLPYFEDKKIKFDFVKKQTERRINNSRLMFTVMDLKHLVHGGRLSKLGGLVGSLLHIKPMVKFNK
ncbi:MAG: DegV family EDD domain-containing protein, partial [Bacilli bacterium]|nr:DegV family EDD domain-containing protein [Bacilli bacterium]